MTINGALAASGTLFIFVSLICAFVAVDRHPSRHNTSRAAWIFLALAVTSFLAAAWLEALLGDWGPRA